MLQSISSVIEALPPEEQIPPIDAMLSPIVAKLFEALQSSTQVRLSLPNETSLETYSQPFSYQTKLVRSPLSNS